ncbi:MAG TPA: 2-dehydro-3-deoxygalactonokinase [Xanthomonadaceae bacterium]|nr:2-dehydro-3-deoxygalactonokinase [Xanthomonadaceae bacterium]
MAALIGLDWGTTRLRAYLYDADGSVLDSRSRPHGIRALPEGGYDAALADITTGWPCCPRLACGMVGARGGWREMPYLDLPVDVGRLATALGQVGAADGDPVHLVPGLRNPARPDVMRGEETQILGALAAARASDTDATFVLPGTHCKWVAVRDGRVVDFRTAMTGELFSLLLRHSILGAGIESEAAHGHARFADGVHAARDSGAAGGLSRLFTARAAMLAGTLAAADVPGWLSGLLIGEEIRGAVAEGTFDLSAPVRLIGEDALCTRYREALAAFSIEASVDAAEAAAAGLWSIATSAGLVASAPAAHAHAGRTQ